MFELPFSKIKITPLAALAWETFPQRDGSCRGRATAERGGYIHGRPIAR